MTEDKCILGSCCCGCSLRTGSLAIGIVGLVCGIINAINGIYNGVRGVNSGWADLISSIIFVLVCVLLIQGVRQERRSFVMIWVWTAIVIIIIDIILAIVHIVTLNIVGGIIILVTATVFIYCVLVVRSYAFSLGSSPTMA